MKITINPSKTSIDIDAHNSKGQVEDRYFAKDVGSAILVIASLLKEVEPPRNYNKKLVTTQQPITIDPRPDQTQ